MQGELFVAAAASGGGAALDETTIGTEFYLGEISGLLSEGADATVTDLWAGTNFIFR